ncbi:MAG TPA: C45 family peptidase [Solirubrobacteraceae bacterium]|nr:C45 family peptidase [Solirubrobacteraceae bacterium]
MAIVELELTGGPRERGCRHGAALRPEIEHLWSQWVACGARQAQPINEGAILSFTGAHEAAAEKFTPDLAEEVDGIGEASGIGYHRAFALSCWDELCSWLAGRGGPRGGGCTSFAVVTPDGPVIGQNQDAWTWWRPVVVARHTDRGQAPLLVTTHPGVVGVLGLSGAGVGIVANSLMPDDRAPGVPFAFVLRLALAAATAEGAVASILDTPRATGANWVVADGDAAFDVETTHAEAHVTRVRRAHAHSNHYLAPELKPREDGIASLPDTVQRESRMRSLLCASDPEGETPASLLRHLADHAESPTAICRHPAVALDDMETLAATVIAPAENLMLVTDGPPCHRVPRPFSVSRERARA